MRINRELRSVCVSAFFVIMGILMIILPLFFEADLMQWGFASKFLGGLVTLVAFIVFIMFTNRALVFKNMFKEENLLARWEYSSEFWQKEIQQDIEESGMGKIAAFFLAGIFLLIGIVVFLLIQDIMLYF